LNLEQTDEYEVRVENRAEEAVTAARGFRPDLILLDIMMPRMVGSDVASQIRADVHLKNTPIVYLSAAVGGKWAKDNENTPGGVPFVAKPASVEQVLAAIEQQLAPRSFTDPVASTSQDWTHEGAVSAN